MFAPTPVTDSFFWFVMRDLKRPNAKQPAYRFLAEQGLEVFTPMTWRLTLRQGSACARNVLSFRTSCLSIVPVPYWTHWWNWFRRFSTVIYAAPM